MSEERKEVVNLRTLVGEHVHNTVMFKNDDLYDVLRGMNIVQSKATLYHHHDKIPEGTTLQQNSYAASFLPFHKPITVTLHRIAEPPTPFTEPRVIEKRENTVPHTSTLGAFSKFVYLPYRKNMDIYIRRRNDVNIQKLYGIEELHSKKAYHHPIQDGDAYYFFYHD